MAARKNHLGPDTLAELENHLRETVDELVRSGVAADEAFQRALKQLGHAGDGGV